MLDFLKDWYYSGEEKWYNFLDKLDEHLPVYGVIDAVDKVIPSFALLIILIIFLLIFGAYLLFASSSNSYSAQFTFFEPDGKTIVYDSVINLTILEKDNVVSEIINRTDPDGRVYLKDLKYGQEVRVDVNLSKGTFSKSYFVDKLLIDENIILQPKVNLSAIKRLIIVKDGLGMNVREPIELSFYCENSSIPVSPSSATTVNSSVEVTEPVNCVKLHAKVMSPKYEQKDYIVTGSSFNLQLVAYEPPKVSLIVKVRTGEGFPINDTSFNVTVTGDNIYTEKTLSSSQATINVVPGAYNVSVNDPNGMYAISSKAVTLNDSTTITLTVTKAIRARISVTVRDVSTHNAIKDATVSIKDSSGRTLAEQTTDTLGFTKFSLTDVSDYIVTAKKVGDTNGGYFAKSITLTSVSSDVNTVLELEKITNANAGKTNITVVDQDNLPISNAKVFLKYAENDSIVELNNNNNFAMTDLNGSATFLAGKVEGLVYAYAIKYPFSGSSDAKKIMIDSVNDFKVTMQVGEATIQINLTEENGNTIDGTARIVSMTTAGQDLSGLISVEQGKATRKIKAGQQVYLAVQSSSYENYVSEPIMLFPNKTYTQNIVMKKQISTPRIIFDNLYSEEDKVVRTMQKGKKYYAKFIIEADQEYNYAQVHFRVGTDSLMENDFMQIDKLESVGITSETRGTSYDPTQGYNYDSKNLTDGYSKWITVEYGTLDRGQRIAKAYFVVNKTAPTNAELQFFWRANFDGTKDPSTTNTGNDLYDDTRASNIYFVGEEATCQDAFCITNESLYWNKDDLYINTPYEIKQAETYTYKYQIYNNSDTDFGTALKKIYLGLNVLGDATSSVKVLSYKIKDASRVYTGSAFTKIDNLEIESFTRNSTIDVELTLEGNAVGTTLIDTSLKADGAIIFTSEASFTVPNEKALRISISPSFLPTLVDTEITVNVTDDKGEPLHDATVKVFAKEPGYEEYLIDQTTSNRYGDAIVHSGAHFPKTVVIIEITKEGYARTRLQTTVSDNVLVVSPDTMVVELNTISEREATKTAILGNVTTHTLKIVDVKLAGDLSGVINDAALLAYFESLIGTELPSEEETTLDLVKVRLSNSITQDTFIEPITITGDIIISVQISDTYTVYDKTVPMTINVSSEANPETSCIILSNATQTKTTQQGQVRFDFDLLNACNSDGTDVSLDALYVSYGGELFGTAELSLVSPTSGTSGRSALDGAKRKVYDKVKAGEQLVGAVTYSPSVDAVGKTITMPITIEGKFQGRTIKTNPASLSFTVNVLNLKECMTISSDAAPVGFTDKSTITIDSSACLGQPIEVALCKNDAGCSGGAEGKITLSKTTLNLKGTSETVDAYNPTLPGSYGVSVYARVKGQSSYNYIGETPVSFRETEDKYFEVSKYDLMLIGDGSMDSVLLKNKMLTQNVNVKADECIWGKKDAKMGLNEWFMVASFAMMGATLGNMIGSGISKDNSSSSSENKTTDEKTKETYDNMSDSKKAEVGKTQGNIQNELNSISDSYANGGTGISDGKVEYLENDAGTTITRYTTEYQDGQGLTHTMYVDATTGANNTQNYTVYDVGPNGYTTTFQTTSLTGTSSPAYNMSVNTIAHQSGWSWKYTDSAANYTYGWATSSYTPSGNPTSTPSGYKSTGYIDNRPVQITPTQSGTAFVNTGAGASQVNPPQQSGGQNNSSSGWTPAPTGGSGYGSARTSDAVIFPAPAPKELDITYNSALLSSLANVTTGLLLPAPLSNISQNIYANQSEEYLVFNNTHLEKYGKISFAGSANPSASVNSTTTGNYGGWGSLIGAVAFGAMAYVLAKDNLYKCGDNYAVVPFTDFVIFLQGDSISVMSPDGSVTDQKDVPSDAGALSFTLDGISANWDFTNADYSSVENVAINFTNTGLNDAKARYGTLTINATKHIHGKLPELDSSVSNSTGTGGENDFDVWCKEPTFGNYWIGDTNEQGLCSGVSEGTYSQKYHIRVVSGEPTDQEAYLKKESSCYNGVLTGSTGPDSVPKVLLNWDWDSVDVDACDYTNPNYSYCDTTQYTITLVKKLALLEDFLKQNSAPTCPTDPVTSQVIDSYTQMNSITETVSDGFIGPEDAKINVDEDHVTVDVSVDNKTGASIETYYSYSIKGEGDPIGPPSPGYVQKTFSTGVTHEIIEFDVPKYEGVYFFTIVFNGPSGTRRTLTRAFENREPLTTSNVCWLPKTTRPNGGVPTIMYYYGDNSSTIWTPSIKSSDQLYNYINFGSYLVKDGFSDDFLNDFKSYYLEKFGEKMSSSEKQILEYLNTSNFKINNRYSNSTEFEPGLYDVWFYIDFGDNFSILDSNSSIEVSNLLIRNPIDSFPFYYTPFDGMLGYKGTRQGYGTSYTNMTEGVDNELQISSDSVLNITKTFEDVGGNGVVLMETKNGAKFVTVNSTVGTRGQLASISYNGGSASMQFTPNFATPVIVKTTLNGTSGSMSYIVNEDYTPVNTGGSLNYWTGAARSKDFYGSNAIDTYNESPDFKLETGDSYGFNWVDTTNNGNMYLKTIMYTPTNNSYIIEAKDSTTTFWTPNNDFSSTATLVGINGMNYNSQVNNSTFGNLQDLFNMVRDKDVCITNDGTSMTFWWNPYVIANSPGTINSLSNEELALVGQ